MWPSDRDSLVAVQKELAASAPEPWTRPVGPLDIGGCWMSFPRGIAGPGSPGDPTWAAAVVMRERQVVGRCVLRGEASASYAPGLLALRIGPVLEEAVRGVPRLPDVLLVDATARDHPRGAGLALHLGSVLDLPTIGVTHRPLSGEGAWPADERGATSPIHLGGSTVACWLRTRRGTRPLVVHPGWRVGLETAVELVRDTAARRTPEPLRQARRLAREARAGR